MSPRVPWKPGAAVDAKVALRHQDIVGYVQQGRGGTTTWEKAVSTEQRHMMVMEV